VSTRRIMGVRDEYEWGMCVIEFHLANRRPSDIDFIQSNACWQDKQLGDTTTQGLKRKGIGEIT